MALRPGCRPLSEKSNIREARAALAPTGTLRAGINLSNFLLVSSRATDGMPIGVAPDLAGEIALRLDVPVRYICYDKPDLLAAAVDDDAWDIGLIGAEPARAKTIAFTSAYSQIECTYLVPAGSPFMTIDDVDRAGVRIASMRGAAYDLWLERNLKLATLTQSKTIDESFDTFVMERLDALSGLRPRLLQDLEKLPGARLLDGCFASVQQAVGTKRSNVAGTRFLAEVVDDVRRSGFVELLIERHGVRGLSATRGRP